MFFDEEGNAQDVKAYHVNEYIQEASGEKFTAKDFRTWGGTKLAAEEITLFKKKDDKKQRKKNITVLGFGCTQWGLQITGAKVSGSCVALLAEDVGQLGRGCGPTVHVWIS